MPERQTVIGFTEAELGFFLLVLVVVLWVVSIAQNGNATPGSVTAQADSVTITRDSLDNLNLEIAALRNSLDSLQSSIWPTCRSRGVASQILLSVMAISADRYIVKGDTLSAAQIALLTRDARTSASEVRCAHEIEYGYSLAPSVAVHEANRQALVNLGLRLRRGPVVP
jgi:hypothetical protein